MTGHDARQSQLDYIKAERRRYKDLRHALTRYWAAAKALNLHPLNSTEINDRLTQLDAMEVTAKSPAYVEAQQSLIDGLKELNHATI